jgi:hypothetical protein
MPDTAYPISYWCAPPTDAARYREVATCGFTVVPIPADTPDLGRAGLDLCVENGLAAIVIDPRIHRGLPQQAGWQQTVAAVVADYGGHPALYGYYLTDEPSLEHFADLASLTRAFEQADPAHLPFINLFPNYASPDQLGTVDYAAHVRAYLETVRPPFLSYDHYALLEWGDRPGYFANLETVRGEALRAGVPFWNIILATPHFDYRSPSAADLKWQVNTTLAYGGKGLAYFTYWTPDVENFRDGIIGLDGQRTAKYDAVSRINHELRHVGQHILGLTSTAVHHWPDAPEGATVLPRDGLVASLDGGQFVAGEFADAEGLPWLMLVNRDRARSARVVVRLRTPYPRIEEVARSTGELRPVSLDQGAEAVRRYADGLVIHFWLGPAEGKLMRLSGG